jgi:hypothetical protein
MELMALIAEDSAAAFGQSSEHRYLDRVAMKGGGPWPFRDSLCMVDRMAGKPYPQAGRRCWLRNA